MKRIKSVNSSEKSRVTAVGLTVTLLAISTILADNCPLYYTESVCASASSGSASDYQCGTGTVERSAGKVNDCINAGMSEGPSLALPPQNATCSGSYVFHSANCGDVSGTFNFGVQASACDEGSATCYQ